MGHIERRKAIIDKIRISILKCKAAGLEVDMNKLINLTSAEFGSSRRCSQDYVNIAMIQIQNSEEQDLNNPSPSI